MGKRIMVSAKTNKGSFFFKGMEFAYHNHYYNATSMNERTVEIPIGEYYLRKYNGRDILEVGNVMSHYIGMEVPRDIVDKYEQEENVTNLDILDYKTDKKYDLILSISTIEHIGNCDEESPNPTKGLEAIEKIVSMLKPDGLFVCTYAIGHNYNLDFAVRDGTLKFDELSCFARESLDVNHWNFCNFKTAFDTPTKGISHPVKTLDGNMCPVGIYFFLLVGLKYGGKENG